MQYEEYYFGLRLLQDPSRWGPGVVYDPAAISGVLDHPNIANPVTFTTVIPNSRRPDAARARACRPTRSTTRRRTRTGVRCTLQDYMVNVVRRATSDGFARRAFDNVGVQYGLKGLRDGR